MALTTQCPFCQTAFRVANDQLKLRGGLVRCGACQAVFNAQENLLPEPGLMPDSRPAPETPAPEPAVPTPSPEQIPPSTEAEAEADPAPADDPISTPDAPAFDRELEVDFDLDLGNWPQDDPAGAEAVQEDPPPELLAAEIVEVPIPKVVLGEDTVETIDFKESPRRAAAEGGDGFPNEDRIEIDGVRIEAADIEEIVIEDVPADDVPAEDVPLEDVPADALAEEVQADDLPADDLPLDDLPVEPAQEATQIAAPRSLRDFLPSHAQSHAQSRDEDEPEEDSQDLGDDDEIPGFVRRARRAERIRRITRLVMGTGSVLLLLAAAAQGAYVFRNQLAGQFPALKPALSEACTLLGCRLGLAAQIDAVTIESSELQQSAQVKDALVLSILLRNHSSMPQAWPHVELTLNDANEKPIVRRIFAPAEYLAAPKDAANGVVAGIAAGTEQPVKLGFEVGQLKPSGYRVYLFYP